VDILGKKVLPRSGFPPDNSYKVVVVGAEPGAKAKIMMTPTHYREHFMPGTKNTNRVRLLFEDLKTAGIDYSMFFLQMLLNALPIQPADSLENVFQIVKFTSKSN